MPNKYIGYTVGATKEKRLIEQLEELKHQWEDIKFIIKDDDDVGIQTLAQLEDIEGILNDHIIQLLNMRSSVFVKPHEVIVIDFYNNLVKIELTIKNWEKVQDDLKKLVPIFTKTDLNKIIPAETGLFVSCYETYNKYIEIIKGKLIVFEVVATTEIVTDTSRFVQELEIVYSGVIRYLETIRVRSPRLYFLSDNELFEVTSDTKRAFDTQTFLIKIFQEICNLEVIDGNIVGVSSKQAEELKFAHSIQFESLPVDDICSQIEKEMKDNLQSQMATCYKLYKKTNLKEILSKFSEQIILVMSQIYWREDMESALRLTHNIKLRIIYQKLKNVINDKVQMLNDTDLNSIQRVKLKNIVVNDINKRTLLETILEKGCINLNQFDWESSIKYYYKDHICTVQMMNSKIPYGYEYLGNPHPLISTPLTDRCFRTLINAYYLQLSGLIRGASGIGKSETIRSLARAFGIFFVAFTCPEQTDSPTLERILKGNAICGSWLCLENLSALSSGVLSSISQTMLAISAALKCNTNSCCLRGQEIAVNPSCFTCACLVSENVELNLPVNMKVLFRTVTMVQPDLTKIAETTLYSYGFSSACDLSKKVVSVFKAGTDIFSKGHYTFDINHLNQVLSECNKLRNTIDNDEMILYTAMKNVFWSQLEEADFQMYDEIFHSVFPEISPQTTETSHNVNNIQDKCAKQNLQINNRFINKVVQTHISLKNNTCIIILGDTYSAKTTILNICKELIEEEEQGSIEQYFINPNYLDQDHLYGDLNKNNSHWNDGVITKCFRKFSFDLQDGRKWLVLDGSINNSWIESMIPILRKNKTFYLKSGECLVLPDNLTTIFEMSDLKHCSPTIVSTTLISSTFLLKYFYH